ncbi:hypothetical protein [Pontibacter kalidii]|uniref:hypothetical protein n=1 Tax=Pontibacter kalidii TaxID=2592049 RepID=UPI00224CE02B|nr:hypothetical protein [Pontibacter kalidii]
MKTIFFIFLLILSAGYAHGQEIIHLNIDSIAEAQSKHLITEKKAEQVLIYESGCLGCEFLREVDCNCEDSGSDIYLIWAEGGKYFTKRIGCCIEDVVKEFSNPTLFKEILSNKSKIFGSQFKTEYEEIHHGFEKLTLVSADRKQEIYIEDFLFAKDNKYREHNLKQPAKVYTDKLSKEFKKK